MDITAHPLQWNVYSFVYTIVFTFVYTFMTLFTLLFTPLFMTMFTLLFTPLFMTLFTLLFAILFTVDKLVCTDVLFGLQVHYPGRTHSPLRDRKALGKG